MGYRSYQSSGINLILTTINQKEESDLTDCLPDNTKMIPHQGHLGTPP